MRKEVNKQWTIQAGFTLDDHLDINIEHFLISRKAMNVAIGTLNFYRIKLRIFSRFCDSQAITSILQLTPDVIRLFLMHLDDTGHKAGGVHAFYRAIKTFLFWWEEETEPEKWKNPIRKVKAPRVPVEPINPVSIETIQALVDTCNNGGIIDDRDRALLFFLLDTGVRAAECLALNIDDVNMLTGAVLIRQGKGRKPRTVFIEKKARKALRAYLKHRKDNNPALWISRENERLKYFTLREMKRRRAARAHVPEPGLHDFRRAFALSMLRNGVDVITLSRLMGHSSLAVLSRYLKQLDTDLQEAHQKYSPMENSSL